MDPDALLGPPRIRRRLRALAERPLNFDPSELDHPDPSRGWLITDLCESLPQEPPGPPVPGGSWAIARRLMRGYEFADPSIVRAYYDPRVPLEQRNMLLKLKALRVLHLYAGVRVCGVYERETQAEGRDLVMWGWSYRTLEGHVEAGQMDWQVWKWVDSGEVEFRVHAVSRRAQIRNPFVRLGFAALRGRERGAFLESTKRRMRRFTELALQHERGAGEPIRAAGAALTARRGGDAEAHDALARAIEEP